MPDTTASRLRHWQGFLLVTLMLLLAGWQFLGDVGSRPLHRDEARWVHRAEYIRELLTPFSPYWDEATWRAQGGTMDEVNRLRAQPPMGSYVMGIGFLLQGQPLPEIGFWNMDQDDAWNIEAGNAPSQSQLLTARRTSAAAGMLTVAAVAWVTYRLTNVAGGMVAGALLAFHPLMRHLATFAGSDAVLGMFIATSAAAALWWADRPSWPRAVLLGMLLGLGGSTKLSPLGIAIPVGLLGALALASHLPSLRDRITGPPPRHGLHLMAVPPIAGVTFLASYPYLWRNPIGHTRALVDYRQLGMEIQSTLWGHIAVPTRLDAFRRIGDRLGAEWQALDAAWIPEGTELAVGAAGLVVLAWLALTRGLWGRHALAATVLAGGAAITVIGMDADWARYHLPILLLTATSTGVLAGSAARLRAHPGSPAAEPPA